jgi:phosphopantothenoylcysteine decarboxylase / phosphopantothenate---cysteine ligase
MALLPFFFNEDMLHQKKIILGITGGIAAYKCAHLVRLLVKEGAEVKVVMTSSARDFITPQTLSVLSKNEVVIDFFDSNNNWNNHVHLAEWADLFLIAPLTANTLSKMANGACDNVLLATYLSAKTKTIVAPAMDLDMYQHPTTRQNLDKISSFGNLIIPAETGELASGLSGEGRMAEPEHILAFLKNYFSSSLPLAGKYVLVNAGPTYEAIDPVRFIGNRSSGKMGIALAESFAKQGANVTLVLGPTHLNLVNKSIIVIRVETAAEMFDACVKAFPNVQVAVCSAAVADYRPKEVSSSKIKKKDASLNLELIKTNDILQELGKMKTSQCLVGFALETDNIKDYALKKLQDKNLDIIIANSASEEGSGFSGDTNKVMIIDKHNKITNFELKKKTEVADDIVNYITGFLK